MIPDISDCDLNMKIILLSLLVLSGLCTARQLTVQRFIEEPRSVSVREGLTVVLSCSVDNKMGVLQWTKGTLHLSLYKNIPEFLSLLL